MNLISSQKECHQEDAEILKKELLDMYGDDVGLNEKKIDEGMHQKCCCKYCGDELYKPTTDCPYDSQDPTMVKTG